jgi:Flp pilus assembly protein TadD
LVLVLFLGFDTVPSDQAQVEKSRALNFETAELESMVQASTKALPADEATFFRTYENMARTAESDTARIAALEQLSAAWFQRGGFAEAGYYAEKIAEIEPSALNWEAAAMTFWNCLRSDLAIDTRTICRSHADQCFQNAISLDPDNVTYRINLAVCNATMPPSDNPMKGIQSLLSLSEKYPENTSVLFWLAKFGLDTGQTDKAIARLQKALEIAPDERRLHCLIAEAYSQIGDSVNAERHMADCNED